MNINIIEVKRIKIGNKEKYYVKYKCVCGKELEMITEEEEPKKFSKCWECCKEVVIEKECSSFRIDRQEKKNHVKPAKNLESYLQGILKVSE